MNNLEETKNRRRRKKKRKKNKKLGLKIYTIVLGVLFLGVLVYLWVAMSNYQKQQDLIAKELELQESIKHAPQEYILSKLDSMTIAEWSSLWYANNEVTYDSEEAVNQRLKELFFENGYNTFKSSDYSLTNPVYLLKSKDDEDLAKIYLTGQDLDWNISKVDFYIGNSSSNIKVPTGSTLYFNGIEISKDYITSTDTEVLLKAYESDLINPVTYDNYEVSGLINTPEVSITGLYPVSLVADNSYAYISNDDVGTDLKNRADKFIRALVYYYMMGKSNTGANVSAVYSYIASGSSAYRLISGSYDGVTWRSPASSTNIETSVGDAVMIADNCYYIDISYKTDAASEYFSSDGIYRVYFLNKNNRYAIYHFDIL